MNDRKFEIYKIIFDKVLIAIILGISTYTVNVLFKNYEVNKEITTEYAKRKADIVYEVAEYATLLHRSFESLYFSTSLLLNNAPPCEDNNAYQVYMTQFNSLSPQFKKIDELTSKMHEIRFKVKLYLGEDISNSFSKYLDSIFKQKSHDYPSKLKKLSNSLSSDTTSCQNTVNALKEMMAMYSINDSTLSSHSEFMNKLIKLLPDSQVRVWKN